MRLIVLVLAVVLSAGCASTLDQGDVRGAAAAKPSTSTSKTATSRRVPMPASDVLKIESLRCASKPTAAVDAETREFLGVVRACRIRTESRRTTKLKSRTQKARPRLDDFLDNRDTRVPARSCRPGDFADLKESFEIVGVNGRRVRTTLPEIPDHDAKYASVWLQRCLPARDAIAWLTADGVLIGVFQYNRFDRFE